MGRFSQAVLFLTLYQRIVGVPLSGLIHNPMVAGSLINR